MSKILRKALTLTVLSSVWLTTGFGAKDHLWSQEERHWTQTELENTAKALNKKAEYQWDESKSPVGPSVCINSMQCDGKRVCVWVGINAVGHCQGTAR